MRMIKQFITLFFLLFSSGVFAQKGGMKLTLEPIYGLESKLVRYPPPEGYVTGATYGARVILGINILSLEGEYTTFKSREEYPTLNTKVEDTAERLSVGLRSTLPLGKFFAFYLRAGGRASQGESIVTTSGVPETKPDPLIVNPYAGAGVQIAIHSNFALNGGATLIRNGEDKYDTQYTLGVSARVGK
jgi:hypothetical protein